MNYGPDKPIRTHPTCTTTKKKMTRQKCDKPLHFGCFYYRNKNTDFFVEFRKIFFCLFHMFLLSKFNNVHGQWTQWQHETNSIHINRKNFEEHRCMSIISSWHKSRLAGNTYKIQNLHTILVHVVNNKQQCACINQIWAISL